MKSDDQLKKDVTAELGWEPSVDAAGIGVEVKDGVVTLAGHVGSFGEKWNAERAAQRVSGVRALAVEMDVDLPGASQRHDADIARAAENVLLWNSSLPQPGVKVMVERGHITITGEVDWEYQRQAATRAVRDLMGVVGVSNNIAIRSAPSSDAVKADIESALRRRALEDAGHIAVQVQGADVTLSGTVHSWSERDLARNTAWGTAGVRTVVDHISVGF